MTKSAFPNFTKIPVSIIIISKNRTKDLRECLTSIYQQLTAGDEIIVIDGSDTDSTKKLVRTFSLQKNKKVLYVYEPAGGYAVARNTGVRRASCPWIAFVDDDCIAHPAWLMEMKRSVAGYPKYNAYTGLSLTFNATNIYSLVMQYYELSWKLPAIKVQDIVDTEILDTKNILFDAKIFNRESLFFRQEKRDNKLLSTDDIDFGMQFHRAGYKAIYCKNAIVYHKDPLEFIQLIRKIMFDRYSYSRYESKWSTLRKSLRLKHKRYTKHSILNILHIRYGVSYINQIRINVLIFVIDKMLLGTDLFIHYHYA